MSPQPSNHWNLPNRPEISRAKHRKFTNNDRYEGDPLLKDYIIVGEYPRPTDKSRPMHRGVPEVKATSESTYAEVVKGNEHIDREDLDEYDFVTTLERVKHLRSDENGVVKFPSCENGQSMKKGLSAWLTRS